MPAYVTPGVYFESADQGAQGISAIRTDIAAFLGAAQKGPVQQPTAVQSWQQFQSAFGAFMPNSFLAYAAKAFFENGGRKLYIVRVAAPAAKTQTAAIAQPPDGSASIVQSAAGFVAGAVATAAQTSTAHAAGVQPADGSASVVDAVSGFIEGSTVEIVQALPAALKSWRTVQAVDSAAKTLRWNSPLDAAFVLANPMTFRTRHRQDLLISQSNSATATLGWAAPLGPSFDLSSPIEFHTGAGTSRGRLYDFAGDATLEIRASSPGAWGDGIGVEVSQSSLTATATSGPQPPGGEASFVPSVTGFVPYSLVRFFQSGVEGYRLVQSVDPTLNLIEWDSPLIPDFNVVNSISIETIEFALTVYVNGLAREIFSGLSLQPRHPKYAVNAVSASLYIAAEDLQAPGPAQLRLPDPGSATLTGGMLALQGGRDGIAALRAIDYIGDPGSARKWGLRALEDIDEVSIVAIPDILIQPAPAVVYAPLPSTPPDPCLSGTAATGASATPHAAIVEAAPAYSLGDIFRVQQAAVQHCETMQFRFAILDAPDFGLASQQLDLPEVQSWRSRFDSAFGALYFPWVLVRDPLNLGSRIVRAIPPSGHVAGVYANTDLTTGVHRAPANYALSWAQGLTLDIDANTQGVLNPLGIDCLRSFRGRGLRIYGARTLSSDPEWRFVNVRRLVSMIEHAMELSLQWTVFEPNNFVLWQTVKVAVTGFLETIWKQGGLAGNTAADAFYVTCDLSTNPLAVTQAGQMIVEFGVAPTQPAEFVIFRIGKVEDTLEVTET